MVGQKSGVCTNAQKKNITKIHALSAKNFRLKKCWREIISVEKISDKIYPKLFV
jgi:hypothetical protein